MSNIIKWKLEDQVNDYVKKELENLGLINQKDFNVESNMTDYMKEALKGSAKTKNKTNFGKPDFHIENYRIPVVFENKLHTNKLIALNKSGLKMDDKSIKNFAVNGAVYYAQNMIASNKYNEVIAIGVAGDSEDDVEVSVYYVFGSLAEPKLMSEYTNLNFLENKKTFDSFYEDATLSEKEKHRILIDSQGLLKKHANNLNVLMNNHNIPVDQRVVYVSGMLLSMQDVVDKKGDIKGIGLVPDDLNGDQYDEDRDGVLVVNQIKKYLTTKQIPQDKRTLMLGSFREAISLDKDRDELTDLDKKVATLIDGKASVTKQVFTYIYEYVYLAIDGTAGHLDIMGEMYSVFLKYALGDGKEIGIVLTPPYVTKMMSQILDVNMESRVMDLATGSAGFLIASMETMIQDAEKTYGKNTTKAIEKIKKIKEQQLLGVELNAKMFTLASTNMILRGDGSSNIQKGSSFDRPPGLYEKFKADKLLLNPPFTFVENGMPFLEHGLKFMEKGGRAAIIIQDSAGSGKAAKTNKRILKNNTLIASIKMPVDTFQPSAGVQTSIYIVEAGKPHNFEMDTVKFIDFRNDGYKRTLRGNYEIDHPSERYQDIVKIFRLGRAAVRNPDFHQELWDLDKVYVEDLITDSGIDWNFEFHQVNDTSPTEEEFMKTVGEYLAFEVNQLLTGRGEND
ncbi:MULTISPECIES: HsdM family class I SAM-dependent methyltransferase [Bacillus]|jgi:type I restriction enzyme M protein|uniref:site-specific DNA-methyltransferase (adenine-specific) n=1 Tax=Bacillus velezensis TaxID=492670 RepID=A0A7W4LU14_BACVE|nr:MULTISPECIES: N-6 DNA methylase [Bacillus]AXS59991.1 SAM-dependent methyltransferase [Bacillus velezensis]MCY0088287.1 SAM-dependent methyltransferase [Bacillus velezensis]MEC0381203.1 N-6 DNA methylase [Bacillus velezensis]QOY25841.1 Restriction enzyme BgcI subunit alpha [Bacillus velezensis]RXJ46243.1 SAM-dependent methyltransferase [Bacillus velezensis]